MIGTILGHYRVLELLGRGGMGEVYAAEDLRLRRRVALKVLPPEMGADPERRRRFEREARAVASLNHPGIVTIYSVEHHGPTTFLTMELVEGQTLDQNVPPGGLPLIDFLNIAIPLADAVNAAHARGILHRDLKPGNVMRTKDGRIKVLDFGLAKLTEVTPSVEPPTMMRAPVTTSVGQIMGTLSYMAPEQAEGKQVDHRADIFGLGALLYELAAGVRPFGGDTNVTVLIGLLRDTPRPITEIRADFPVDVAAIIQRCLEKEPEARYQSAAELSAALEAIRGTVVAVPAAASVGWPRWTYAAGLALAILVGVSAWFTMPAAPSQLGQPSNVDTPVLITGNRLAILDFENRTGDPQLSAFGRMVSEAIATALAAKGLPVVSATEASANDGLTIAGSYSIDHGDLRFDGRVMSASRGIVVRTIDPVLASRKSLLLAADESQRRIMTAILAALPAGTVPEGAVPGGAVPGGAVSGGAVPEGSVP